MPTPPVHESHNKLGKEAVKFGGALFCKHCGKLEGDLAEQCPANKLYTLTQRVKALEAWKASHREWHNATLRRDTNTDTAWEIDDEPRD